MLYTSHGPVCKAQTKYTDWRDCSARALMEMTLAPLSLANALATSQCHHPGFDRFLLQDPLELIAQFRDVWF